MKFYVYTKAGKRAGFLVDYTSVQWNFKYQEAGTFELHVINTETAREQMKPWYIISATDEHMWPSVGIIEAVEFSEDNTEITVRGHTDLLNMFINRTTLKVKDTASIGTAFENLKASSATDLKTSPEEDIGIKVYFNNGVSYQVTLDTPYETTYTTLRELLNTFCVNAGVGYRVSFNERLGLGVIVYKGADSSVWFSENNATLAAQEYIRDYSDYANIAYVYGAENDDGTRSCIKVTKRQNGEPCIEMYVDARDIQWTYKDANDNEVTYTQEEYYALLKQRGIEKLKEAMSDAVSYTFEIIDDSDIWNLGADYWLGSTVKVISNTYGITKDVTVTGVKFVDEPMGQSYTIETEEDLNVNYDVST